MTTSTAAKPNSARSSQRHHSGQAPGGRVQGGRLDPGLLAKSLPDALRKLDPRPLWRNPVMFIVEIGAVWSTILAVAEPSCFSWVIVIWRWQTVIFAILPETGAEVPGTAQAES